MKDLLLTFYKGIARENEGTKIWLTGSLAIDLHGVKLRRSVGDLDIMVPKGTELKDIRIPKGYEELPHIEKEGYNPILRVWHPIFGFKIEFMVQELDDEPVWIESQQIWVSKLEDILAAKRYYVENGLDKDEKHKQDLYFIGL